MLRVSIAALLIALVSTNGPPAAACSGGNCPPCDADNNCQDGNPFGFVKIDGGVYKPDTTKLKCCVRKGSIKSSPNQKYGSQCYDDRVAECKGTSDIYGGNVVCSKKYGAPCGDSCCNLYTEYCYKYEPTNGGFKYETCRPMESKSNDFTTNSRFEKNKMLIIAVPIIGIVFQLIAVVSIALIARNILGALTISGKVAVIVSLLATFLSLFFYFTEFGWAYPVVVAVVSAIVVASLASDSFSLHLFTVFISLFLVLYVFGGPASQNGFFGFGPGIFEVLPSFPTDKSANCYGSHFIGYTGYGTDYINAPASTDEWGWGYCGRGFITFLWFVGLLVSAFVAFIPVSHAVAVFTPRAQ